MPEIEDEDIFEKEPEPSVEELLKDVPPQMANYLRATQKILKEGAEEFRPPVPFQGITGFPVFVPPKRTWLCERYDIELVDTAGWITENLNKGWTIERADNYGKWLFLIFSKIEPENDAENLTDISESDKKESDIFIRKSLIYLSERV